MQYKLFPINHGKYLFYRSHDATDQPTSTVQTTEEEEDDAEYNVLADLHCDEDYEELRNDRAVHISRERCPLSLLLCVSTVMVLCRERS